MCQTSFLVACKVDDFENLNWLIKINLLHFCLFVFTNEVLYRIWWDCILSVYSYGLRYQYGLFRQIILDGFQHEQPDYWLNFGNPWEIERIHVTYPVKVCKYYPLFNIVLQLWTSVANFSLSAWISSMELLKRNFLMREHVKFGFLERWQVNKLSHIFKLHTQVNPWKWALWFVWFS